MISQKIESVADRQPEHALREMSDFNRRERLDVQVWIERAQALQQLQIPLLLQGRVQTANHVNFSNALRKSFRNDIDNLIDRILERMCVSLLCGKRAELT